MGSNPRSATYQLCVTLGTSLNLSRSPFSHLQSGYQIRDCLFESVTEKLSSVSYLFYFSLRTLQPRHFWSPNVWGLLPTPSHFSATSILRADTGLDPESTGYVTPHTPAPCPGAQ